MNKTMPEYIKGYGNVTTYGSDIILKDRSIQKEKNDKNTSKVATLEESIKQSGLKDGMTISFHHHLRNGDYVMKLVFEVIKKLGIKDITLSSSSLSKTHDYLLEYLRDGTITKIFTTGLRGKLAHEVQHHFALKGPVVFMTHGGRVRAIEEGRLKIDITFIAASCCDELGNMNGKYGESAFGAIGYPVVDAQFARHSVAITDNLVDVMTEDISISGDFIDQVVLVDIIGDPSLIATDSTRNSNNPMDLLIARKTADILINSGYIKEGYSFQAGSGSISLSVCRFLKNYMIKEQIIGSFAAGGVTSQLVDLLEAGLFRKLYDVQTFGKDAILSLIKNENHVEMSAHTYANPSNIDCMVNKLDVMILSATEIDINFNINSITGSNGVMMGALGGAPDTTAGAKLSVVVAPSMRKRIPIIVDKVTTICTPGENIDILVTERGICVNPNRPDLIKIFNKKNIDIMPISELKDKINKLTGIPNKLITGKQIVGIVEYRDGSVLDLIYDLV